MCTLYLSRLALIGIFLATLIGTLAASNFLLRILALIVLIYSSWRGLLFAWEQTVILMNPSPFATCAAFLDLPNWLPLDKWLPALFEPTGDCSTRYGTFLLEIPEWLVIVFSGYLLVGLLFLVSQFFTHEEHYTKARNRERE